MPPRFLEGRLYLPTHHKPTEYLVRIGFEVGTQECVGFELSLRIADHYPAYRYGGQSRAVPDCRGRSHFHAALSAPIPVLHGGGYPNGGRIFGHDRKVGQAFAFQTWSSYLPGSAGRSRIVECCVQTQASDERHRFGQEALAACEESEASVSGIGHRNDLSLGPPAPHQQEHLSCPVGYLLVLLAPLGGVALGRSKC